MDVSIIVVNWNTKQLLFGCLKSIYDTTTGSNLEVIVVDNGSHDGSSQAVKDNFPKAKLIQNPENQGFAKANNQALLSAAGRSILLLNSDTLLTNGSLTGPLYLYKSPLLAGLLAAVIQGAGYFYMEKKKQAVFSFITNALLFFGGYEAFAKELYVAGGFLSFFSLNYYSGNIFGALNETHKFNRSVKKERLEKVSKRYDLSINLKEGREGVLLGFALNF